MVEALNPKTAAFFLAFLPQFVDPSAGAVWLQFLGLGLVSVTLNTAVDVMVVVAAARARSIALGRPTLLRRLRTAPAWSLPASALACCSPADRPEAQGRLRSPFAARRMAARAWPTILVSESDG